MYFEQAMEISFFWEFSMRNSKCLNLSDKLTKIPNNCKFYHFVWSLFVFFWIFFAIYKIFFFFFLSELKSPSSDPRNRLGRTSAMTSDKCLSSELITVLDALFDFDAHLAAICGF